MIKKAEITDFKSYKKKRGGIGEKGELAFHNRKKNGANSKTFYGNIITNNKKSYGN